MMLELAFIFGVVETGTIVAILTALFVPLGAYLVAVRQFSGRIESSDAKELWAESRAIREWSQRRITELEQNANRLEERVDKLEKYNHELHAEKRVLELKAAERDATIKALREEVEDLIYKLERANQRIAELELKKNE